MAILKTTVFFFNILRGLMPELSWNEICLQKKYARIHMFLQ